MVLPVHFFPLLLKPVLVPLGIIFLATAPAKPIPLISQFDKDSLEQGRCYSLAILRIEYVLVDSGSPHCLEDPGPLKRLSESKTGLVETQYYLPTILVCLNLVSPALTFPYSGAGLSPHLALRGQVASPSLKAVSR